MSVMREKEREREIGIETLSTWAIGVPDLDL